MNKERRKERNKNEERKKYTKKERNKQWLRIITKKWKNGKKEELKERN